MPEQRTGCRYHTQDLSDSCGAAVAMMIFEHRGIPANGFDQRTALGELTRHGTSGVRTRPNDLLAFLNARLGDGIYRLQQPGDFADLASLVLHTLNRQVRLPLAIPIYSNGHWTVIEGIKFSQGPNPKVKGVWIHRPEHWGFNNPPPHHGNDACGRGGSRGQKEDYQSVTDWRDMVVQPNPPFRRACLFSAPLPPAPLQPQVLPPPPERPFNRETILSELAFHELEQQLGPLTELEMGDPLQIRRLDLAEADYWLTPLVKPQGIVALACFDAAGAWLRSVGFPEEPITRLLPSATEIVTALMSLGQLGSFLPPAAWWHQQLSRARYVWRPSVESFSPYWPFIEVPLGGVLPWRAAYVRFDLRVFFQLTEPAEGG